MNDYDYYVDPERGAAKLEEGKEIRAELRDTRTFERINARVIVYPQGEDHPDADRLWYYSAATGREKQPRAVKILEVFPEETQVAERLPSGKVALGQRKGRMLMDMIKERKERKEGK